MDIVTRLHVLLVVLNHNFYPSGGLKITFVSSIIYLFSAEATPC